MNYKRFFRQVVFIFACAFPLSVVASYYSTSRGMSTWEITKFYVIVGLVIMVAMSVFQYKSAVKFNTKTQELLKILFDSMDFERYVIETNKAIKETRKKEHRELLKLNLSVGYSEVGQYQKALDILNTIHISYLTNINCAIYYNNLANYNLTLGEVDKAEAIFERHKSILEKYKKDKQIGVNITFNYALRKYSKEDLEGAEELLIEAGKLADNKAMHHIIDLYMAKLYAQTNRLKEGKILVKKILKHKPMPYVASEANKLLEEINKLLDVK